jgi:hypothetical protein
MRKQALKTGLLMFFLTSISQAAWSVDVPENPLERAYANQMKQQQLLFVHRAARFQENLRIGDQTLALVLPIEQAHRMRVNEVLQADISGDAPLNTRQILKNIRLIERETTKKLRQHLTKPELRRWRQSYRMKNPRPRNRRLIANRSQHGVWSSNETGSYSGLGQTYKDYGSAYYQQPTQPPAQNCD